MKDLATNVIIQHYPTNALLLWYWRGSKSFVNIRGTQAAEPFFQALPQKAITPLCGMKGRL